MVVNAIFYIKCSDIDTDRLSMSAIARFKKKGGFLQLLKLVETSGIKKQEKFLHLIEDESPLWAQTVKDKMLTFEKVLAAEDEILIKIFTKIKDLTLAAASFAMTEKQKIQILNLLPSLTQRRINDQLDMIQPGESEITTAVVQILAEIRQMIENDKKLLEAIDPKLKIEDDLEDKLLGVSQVNTHAVLSRQEDISKSVNTGSVDADEEIFRLRKKIKDLQNEMDRLAVQNHDLKAKLDRIIKLAS